MDRPLENSSVLWLKLRLRLLSGNVSGGGIPKQKTINILILFAEHYMLWKLIKTNLKINSTSTSCYETLSRQHGRVVSASDSHSSGAGLESRSDHYLDLFHDGPEFRYSAMVVNSQPVCIRPVGILYFFQTCLYFVFTKTCLLVPRKLPLSRPLWRWSNNVSPRFTHFQKF